MATYAELFGLRNDSVLMSRVTAAVIIAAETVMNELGTVPNHANRLIWAKGVFANPFAEANQMFMAVLAANGGLSVAAIQAASDSAIQTNIDAHINLFADLPLAVPSVLDASLEIARGNIAGLRSVNKFGRSTNVDNGVDTDIWDRANMVDDQDIWLAPTTARIHNIVSSSVDDDGAPVGSGARTLRIFGLTDWDAVESAEDITLNGVSAVATSNPYVVIHRMLVLTSGAAGPNVGKITATATTDGTVTAQINEGEGQTQMAIQGIPSIQKAYMTSFYGSVFEATGADVNVDMRLLFNPESGSNGVTWLVKHSLGYGSQGNSPFKHSFRPYNRFEGPGILKLQAVGSANNLDVSAGFDLIVVNN